MKTALEILGKSHFNLYRRIGLLPYSVVTLKYISSDDLKKEIIHTYAYRKAERKESLNTSNRWNAIFEETVNKSFNEVVQEAVHDYLSLSTETKESVHVKQ